MLEASLGETVVVVVVLTELAVTVTVTVTSPGFPVLVDDVEDVEEVLDDVVVLDEETLSEPVTPPLTPAAVIREVTVLSLEQTRDVP
jgi:metal-sulfur cluster biosynthetic enzyme